CRLPQAQIPEADLIQYFKFIYDLLRTAEEMQSLFNRQVQHFMDIPAVVMDPQDFRLIARPLALFANQFDIGQELHFHGDRTVALAGLAATTRDIEREVSGCVSVLLRFRQGSEQFSDWVKRLDVGHRVRPRRPSDWGLVNEYYFVDVVVAIHTGPRALRHNPSCLLLGCRQGLVKNVMYQCRFAGPRYAGHRHDHVERDLDVKAFEVVTPNPGERDCSLAWLSALRRHRDM